MRSRVLSFIGKTMLWVLLLPSTVWYTGAASNQLVIVANNGKFPVQTNPTYLAKHRLEVDREIAEAQAAGDGGAVQAIQSVDAQGMLDSVHCVMTKNTHFNLLADIFDLHSGIYSIGDFMLMLGEWLGTFCPYVWGALALMKLKEK